MVVGEPVGRRPSHGFPLFMESSTRLFSFPFPRFPPSASCKHIFPFHLVQFRGARMHRLPQYWSFSLVTFLLLLAWKPSAAVVALCISNQSTALLQFKQGLYLPGPESLISWGEGSDCCNWEGVICETATGFVIRLQLSGATLGADNSSRVDPSLFGLSRLRLLDLSENRFGGPIPSRLVELRELTQLNLSNAGFSGQIPPELSHMRWLISLDLSSNCYGSSCLQLGNSHLSALLGNLNRLRTLHLDGINISMNGADCISVISSALRNLQELSLPLCFISGPTNESILQLKSLSYLDLRGNNLSSIPECFGNLTSLRFLSLRGCSLRGTFPSAIFTLPHLQILDISDNSNMQVSFPARLPLGGKLQVLKLSSTGLGGSIPDSIRNLSELRVIHMSKCNFTGSIPEHLCSSWILEFLDLSNNGLVGSIPSCLTSSVDLSVLDLSKNQLEGQIPDAFGTTMNCSLETLNLNSNRLSGRVPTSLSKCRALEVLDLSNNELTGEFPSWLGGLTKLRVLSLSSNNFYGSLVPPPQYEVVFPVLHILDVSSNNLGGTLDPRLIRRLRGMMKREPNGHQAKMYGFDYEDRVTLTINGRVYQVHTTALITSMDLSNNHFTGEIPSEIGILEGLIVLNMSNNHLVGQMTGSLANLRWLESLDLSRNNLSGCIPTALSNLTFLSVLNLSFNKLQGRIPLGNQLSTFEAPSFEGNPGLCGPPLTRTCPDANPGLCDPPLTRTWPDAAPPKLNTTSDPKTDLMPLFIAAELGFIVGLASALMPVFLVRRVRWWLFRLVDTSIELALRRLHLHSCIFFG